jgi:hypothetical protein
LTRLKEASPFCRGFETRRARITIWRSAPPNGLFGRYAACVAEALRGPKTENPAMPLPLCALLFIGAFVALVRLMPDFDEFDN